MNRFHAIVLASAMLVSSIVLLAVDVPNANACTPPRCEGGFLRQAGKTIPANAEGVVWRPRTTRGQPPEVGPSNVQLMENDGWGLEEVAVSVEEVEGLGPNVYLVKPDGGFESDYIYTFNGADFCDDDGSLQGDNTYTESFDAGSEASSFSSLGTLELAESKRGTMTIWGQGGMCEEQVEAEHRTLNLELSGGAAPWKSTLMYRTEVKLPGDDQYGDWTQWSQRPDLHSWDDPGGTAPNLDLPRTTTVDVPTTGAWLYRVCDEDRSGGLPEGRWQVRIEAYRPATEDTWTSNTVEVPLSCGELPPPSDDTGVGSDAGDAGSQGDVNWSGNGGAGNGCGCSTGVPSAPSGAALLFAFGLLAVRHRNSRR